MLNLALPWRMVRLGLDKIIPKQYSIVVPQIGPSIHGSGFPEKGPVATNCLASIIIESSLTPNNTRRPKNELSQHVS